MTLDGQYAEQSSKIPEKRQAIFAQTKRKRKNVEHKEVEEEEPSEMDDDTKRAMARIDAAWKSQFDDETEADTPDSQMKGDNAQNVAVLSPRARALRASPFNQKRSTAPLTAAMLANHQRPGYSPSPSAAPDSVSTRSVYAIPDELSGQQSLRSLSPPTVSTVPHPAVDGLTFRVQIALAKYGTK